MADLTDEEIAELRQDIRTGDFGDAGKDVGRLLEEVERRRRERGIVDAFIAGLCLRTGLDYTRERTLLENVIANPAAGRRG